MTPEGFRPQPGPQEQFSGCEADIAIMGGSAGGGKTISLLMEAARWPLFVHPRTGNRIRNYAGVIFRRDLTDIKGSGGMWEEARRMYTPLGARMREGAEMDATWDDVDSKVMFRGLQYTHTVHDYQGYQFAFIGLDELTHLEEYQFWYLVSRLRSTCGVRPYLRATCNPDSESWVKTLISWWIGEDGYVIQERSGVLRWMVRSGDEIKWFGTKAEAQSACLDPNQRPLSFTFIRSQLSDNRALLKQDPGYASRLAMMDAVTRAKLLHGNWNARATSGSLFSRGWFGSVDTLPDDKDVVMWVRGWDRAASAPSAVYPNPDWSVGVLLAYLRNGRMCVCDVQRTRQEPGGTEAWVGRIVKADGPKVTQAVWQDPAQGGKVEIMHTQRVMRAALPSVMISVEIEKKDKLTYAQLVSAAVDPRTRAHQCLVDIVAGPWNQPFFSEIEAFPDKESKKDQVDALSRAYLQIHNRKEGFAGDFMAAMRRER